MCVCSLLEGAIATQPLNNTHFSFSRSLCFSRSILINDWLMKDTSTSIMVVVYYLDLNKKKKINIYCRFLFSKI